jgi:excisionase family DNA binding protein
MEVSKTMSENSANEPLERTLSIDDAAAQLGISHNTMRWWAQTGKIPSLKIHGRRLIAESVLRKLIEESRQPARDEEAA